MNRTVVIAICLIAAYAVGLASNELIALAQVSITPNYITVAEDVEAVQFDTKKELPANVKPCYLLMIPNADGGFTTRPIYDTDWIVTFGNGDVARIPNDVFTEQYEVKQ